MANKPNITLALGNKVSTTLDGSITNSALTIDVNSAAGMNPSGGYGIIEKENPDKTEIVYVESVAGNTLTIATNGRGLAGTSAVAHDTGVTFKDIAVADLINGIAGRFLIGHEDDGTHKADSVDTSAIQDEAVTPAKLESKGGWDKVTDSWAYASATTITVPSGAASIYAVGDKLKIDQSGTKYFYIVGVADTVLTVTGGSDYSVANEAISDIYVAKGNAVGFPGAFNYTPDVQNITVGNGTVVGRFSVQGRTCLCRVRFTFGSSGSVVSSNPLISVPIIPDGSTPSISGTGTVRDGGTATYIFSPQLNVETGFIDWAHTSGGNTNINGTFPMTWASGDYMQATLSYFI